MTARSKIEAVEDEELRRLFEALRQENAATRQENTAAHTETRRHFDVVIESTTDELRLVAEGVAATREELTRTAADHADRIARAATETQAMIKFSHAELDRRMRSLEEAVSDLQSRVERLETSTH
jgi:hypothetical protein